MLKKIIRDLVIVFCALALWVSTSGKLSAFLYEYRKVKAWWGEYLRNHGDLVSLAYLDFVHDLNQGEIKYVYKRPNNKTALNKVLYLFGDSYTWELSDTAFVNLNGFHYINRYDGSYYHLDTTRKNILIIEFSERAVRDYFSDMRIFDAFADTTITFKSAANFPFVFRQDYKASIPEILNFEALFNKNVNQNLQFNLFNYQFLNPMFEFKAALNYYVFTRASGDVVISKDKKFLYFKETTLPYGNLSSYSKITEYEITSLVNNFNRIYDHYKEAGFSEIYLSLIPNPVTIMEPRGYNLLIPRIQCSPTLRMPVIDIYSKFKSSSEVLYIPGDTHWNINGKQHWLDQVNELLILN